MKKNNIETKKHGIIIIIDRIVSYTCVGVMFAILLYFLFTFIKSKGHPVIPNEAFLYASFYLLQIMAYIYLIIFVIKATYILFNKDSTSYRNYGTPIAFDLIVIVAVFVFPMILS